MTLDHTYLKLALVNIHPAVLFNKHSGSTKLQILPSSAHSIYFPVCLRLPSLAVLGERILGTFGQSQWPITGDNFEMQLRWLENSVFLQSPKKHWSRQWEKEAFEKALNLIESKCNKNTSGAKSGQIQELHFVKYVSIYVPLSRGSHQINIKMMHSSEGSLFSLKTKANAQLYEGTQYQPGQRSSAGQVSTLLPGETTQTFGILAVPVTFQIKIFSKQRKSGKTCTCTNFRERGRRKCHLHWWLKILSIFPLLSSSESTIHREIWSDAQNHAIPPLPTHHSLLAAHPLPGTQGKNLSWHRTCSYNSCQFYDNSQNRQVNGSSQNSINQIPHYTHREGKEIAKSW